jgi:hypothetical protein
VNSTCTVSSGFFQGQTCENITADFDACTTRPSSIEMKYTGGDCTNSRNRQAEGFFCTDTTSGPPPTTDNTSSYILVTDTVKRGNVYFRDFVSVGSNYVIVPPASGDVPDFLRIVVYSSNVTGNPTNLLQEVQFASSCSTGERLWLKDQFGASLIVGYENEDQGVVSSSAPVAIQVAIGLPESFVGSIDLTMLDVLSNFDGFQDYSNLVNGTSLQGGESISLDLPGSVLDLAVRRRYTTLTQAAGTKNLSGFICDGSDFKSFVAGNPPPPMASTPSPSISPMITPGPTENNLQLACSVQAEVTCECLSGDEVVVGDCLSIPDPRTVSCTNALAATGLSFKYAGFDQGNSPDTVVVSIVSPSSGFEFSMQVSLGMTFQVTGNFGGSINISASSVSGELLDMTSVNTDCSADNSMLTLTSKIGPLELIGFENASGSFSSIFQIRLSYRIENTGNFEMVADSAMVNSDFAPSTFEALQGEEDIAAQSKLLVFTETSSIDTATKFSQNTVLSFGMSVSGRAKRSTNLACADDAMYTF